MAQENALAFAAAPQHHHRLALEDVEVDAAQYLLGPVALLKGAQRNERAALVIVPHQSSRKSLVRKKSEISTLIDAATTAEVVARPTPSAPPAAVSPLKHAMIPIR